MDTARAADPERSAAYELVTRCQQRIGLKTPVSARKMIIMANELKEHSQRYKFPKFRALLLDQAGSYKGDQIDPVRLGKLLHKQHGRVYGGYRIDLVAHKGRSNEYVLVEIEGDNTRDK